MINFTNINPQNLFIRTNIDIRKLTIMLNRVQFGRTYVYMYYTFAVGKSLTVCNTVTIFDQWLKDILSSTEKWEVYLKCREICWAKLLCYLWYSRVP